MVIPPRFLIVPLEPEAPVILVTEVAPPGGGELARGGGCGAGGGGAAGGARIQW